MQEDNIPTKEEELLAEADRLAAEVEADVAAGELDNIGSMNEVPEITPEMLEGMDPVQLQALMAQLAEQQKKFKRLPQAFYTRKQTTAPERKKKRDAQKKARAISSRNGNGKSMSLARRRKSAA